MMAAMEIEPEKFRPQYKVHKIFRVGGVKTRVGWFSGNNNFLGLIG